ncbi:MAG: hypothetical protein EOP06_26555 [Proteobacteria bacterium]|nr:MAG: hypothetical protein EOP06_26555 [Pseudomonadota bacterium]
MRTMTTLLGLLLISSTVFADTAILTSSTGARESTSNGAVVLSAELRAEVYAGLKRIDQSQKFKCFRNLSEVADSQMMARARLNYRTFTEERMGHLYVPTGLEITLPPGVSELPVMTTAEQADPSTQTLTYTMPIRVSGLNDLIPNERVDIILQSKVTHTFDLIKGQTHYKGSKVDIVSKKVSTETLLPYVRCGQFSDITLKANACLGGKDCNVLPTDYLLKR